MQKNQNKATLLASLGAGLEYYDFVIYGLMASTLSSLFFTGEGPVALAKTFGVFAVGYIARPIGGVFFGALGDAYGRKKTFLFVMLLMSFSTLSIGLLPTYAGAGIVAPCALLFFRFLQGLSFGAELPGAITVVSEHSEKKKWGLHTGFVVSSVSLGATLASLILYVLSQTLSAESISSFGWRIPFLLGGIFSIVNYFIRKHLTETPPFSKLQQTRGKTSPSFPILQLAAEHKSTLLAGISMTAVNASLVIFFLYFPTYISGHFGYSLKNGYLGVTWGMIWASIMLPIAGRLADKFGKQQVYLFSCLLLILTCFPLFSLLRLGSVPALLLFSTLFQTVLAFLSVSYFSIISSIFSTEVRYTGISFCYNIVYCLMGFTPFAIIAVKNPILAPSIIVGFAIISVLGAFIYSKTPSSLRTGRI